MGQKKKYGLVGVGNALVDVLAKRDEDFLCRQFMEQGMKKGAMNLIDVERAKTLNCILDDSKKMSGGSAANSVSVFSSFGGQGAFIGKVGDDDYGVTFRDDLSDQGIEFSTPSYKGDEETGRSYIIISPDGERTLNTYLGVNGVFGPDDVDETLIADSEIVLLEGYLFDKPEAKKAFMKAAQAAKAGGTKVALTLSDANCVKRHYDDFYDFIHNHVDILIGNEKEVMALTLKGTFEEAVKAVAPYADISVMTHGAKGAVIVSEGKEFQIAPVKPEKLVDTTGAGDAFAGGVLYGISEGMDLGECGKLGAKAASKTISHVGARSPDVKFSDFLPK